MKLTGSDLVSRVDALRAEGKSATEVVLACGYVKENGKGAYTEFYTELLEAKGAVLTDALKDNDGEVSEEYQEEYDRLVDIYSQDAVEAFIELYGEECLESFEDAYQGEYDSEADFAEQFTTDVYGDIPAYVVVDWEATWNSNLQYDFDYEGGFVFNRNF